MFLKVSALCKAKLLLVLLVKYDLHRRFIWSASPLLISVTLISVCVAPAAYDPLVLSLSHSCLNACTYCKTKHARGDLASYSIEELVERARQSFQGESDL